MPPTFAEYGPERRGAPDKGADYCAAPRNFPVTRAIECAFAPAAQRHGFRWDRWH